MAFAKFIRDEHTIEYKNVNCAILIEFKEQNQSSSDKRKVK